jgi:6-phosphogluconolactonase
MEGTVRAFKMDSKSMDCELLNEVSTKGGAPCHLSISNDGRWLFTATYMGKSALMFPIMEDGSLGEAKEHFEHSDVKSTHWRQEASHAHCSFLD